LPASYRQVRAERVAGKLPRDKGGPLPRVHGNGMFRRRIPPKDLSPIPNYRFGSSFDAGVAPP